MPDPDHLDHLIAAGAATLGLRLDPAWHAAIRQNLAVSLGHAANVEGFPLPDDAEPAPVFCA